MRVVSANLQHGLPDPIGRPDLMRALAPLRALDADVYAFQELDHRRCRTWWADQAGQLANALDGKLLAARGKGWLWASQRNALVVRGEIVEREVLRLPAGGEVRVAAVAQVVLGGQRWSIATAHLSLDPQLAAVQLEVTLDALASRAGPRVLAGDLNLRPERVDVVAAAKGWELVDGPHTINARTGLNRRLDHILVQGATVIASGAQKLPVSDHLAIWADVAGNAQHRLGSV